MATVDGLSKARMLAIEGASVTSGAVDPETGHLILTTHGGDDIDAGYVLGDVVDATDTLKGIVELATDAETTTGTDTVRAVTPHGVAAAIAALSSVYQALDSDLTAIAALAPANDAFIQRKSGAWTSRTPSQVATDLASFLQPLDADLTAIAALAASANDIIQYKAGSWVNRTMAQLATDLALATTYQPLDADLTAIAALTGTNDNVIQRKAGAWTERTMAQLGADLTSKADTASPTFTGVATVSGSIVSPSDALSVVSNHVSTDAATGNYFRVSATANFTLDNPTNSADGQTIEWEIIQDGTGSRTITLGTNFALGTDITSITLTTTANKRDFLTARYNSTSGKWYIRGFIKGF